MSHLDDIFSHSNGRILFIWFVSFNTLNLSVVVNFFCYICVFLYYLDFKGIPAKIGRDFEKNIVENAVLNHLCCTNLAIIFIMI